MRHHPSLTDGLTLRSLGLLNQNVGSRVGREPALLACRNEMQRYCQKSAHLPKMLRSQTIIRDGGFGIVRVPV